MEEKYALASFNSLILQLRCQHCLAFPFLMEGAVIGRVNPELFALAAGTWNLQSSHADNCKNQLILEEWMQNYVNALCINSWQVKKYIDAYSASSVIGFSNEDLLHVSDIYAQAQDWSHSDKELVLYENESCYTSLPSLKRQINAYFKFLASVAELARSKWTEFNLMMMGTGFGIMITSLFIHFFAIKRVDKLFEVSLPSRGNSGISFWLYFAYAVVAVRASSVLSNSYILEEGKVANFLLATTGILNLRYSIVKKKMLLEALVFVLLTSILRFTIELGLSKQAVSSVLLNFCPSWMCGAANDCPVWIYAAEIVPMLSLILLAYILYKSIACISCNGILKYVVIVTFFSYMLIAVYWALESNILSLPLALEGVKRNFIPRLIYGIGFAQLSVLALVQLLIDERSSVWEERVAVKSVAMLSAWSSTVIILSGKQGPLVALASIVGGWCIMRCLSSEQETKSHNVGILNLYSFPVTQWSLLAVGLFFCTGHWCAFDGLRYAAAFIGFDEFILIPQAILLTIETFGFSHILPIFGLPLVVAYRHPFSQAERRKQFFFMQLCEIYLIYGLIVATTVTFTILCVIIQRRHLMVWGLFAPKFVFDVVGLILTDILICLASLYYFGGLKVDTVHDGTT